MENQSRYLQLEDSRCPFTGDLNNKRTGRGVGEECSRQVQRPWGRAQPGLRTVRRPERLEQSDRDKR